MPEKEELSAAVRRIRREAGLSQTEAARLSAYAQATVSKLERGQYYPPLVGLKRIAKACGYRVVIRFEKMK
ncbi:MAG: helix-turn-helix transcriptional regulator [Pyrinomonadaceae bacterium]